MKLNIVLAVVLLSVFTVNVVSAWREDFGGLVLWEEKCDFVAGNVRDLYTEPSDADECGTKCFYHPGCTHFTWISVVCIMKTAPASEKFQYLEFARCGKIPSKLNISNPVLPNVFEQR